MPPHIDWEAVAEFIEALGRSDSHIVLALFPPQRGPCLHIPCPADEIPTDTISSLLHRYPTHSLGLVINPAYPQPPNWGQLDQHYHYRNNGTRGPLKAWGAQQDHIAHAVAIWAECDGSLTLEAQEALPLMAGLPAPSLSIWSGGKSLHHYWVITPGQELDLNTFRQFQQRLAHAFLQVNPDSKPDDSLGNPNRLMRVPGGRHPATGNRAYIHRRSTETFSAAELDAALPHPPPQTQAASTPASGAGKGMRSQWFDALPAATQRQLAIDLLKLLPPRQAPGTGTYPAAFSTLAALVHHFGADAAVEICDAAGWHNEHWDPARKAKDIKPAKIQASIGKLIARAELEAGWCIPQGLPPYPPALEPISLRPDAPTPAAEAPPADPPQATPSACRHVLQQAVDDDLSPADIELLIHELSTRSAYSPFTLRALLAAIRHQAEQVQIIEAQAAALATPAPVPQSDLKLPGILPPITAFSLQVVTQFLPYTDAAVAMAFLAAISGLTKLGTSVCGNAATQFTVPTNLYVATVAATGQKKTPLQKLVIDNPTHPIRLELARDNTRAMHNWREQCQGMKKDERPPQPTPIYLHIQDYTGEALVAQLQALEARAHAVLVLRDELAGLFGSMNQYRSGRGADEQQLLELFDGSPHASLRVASGDRSYSRCHVSIYGGIQPEVLTELVSDGDATGKWARFIFSPLPPRTKQLPVAVTPAQEQEITDANNVLQEICQRVYSMPPRRYSLDPESIAAFSRYEHRKQEEAQSARLNSQRAIKGKAAGKVLRIAGLLHVLAAAESDGYATELISYSTLQTAIEIVEAHDAWAFGFHERVADRDGMDQNVASFPRKLHEVALEAGEPLTWREIRARLSAAQKRGIDVGLAEAAMKSLERRGLGVTSQTARGAMTYLANPPRD